MAPSPPARRALGRLALAAALFAASYALFEGRRRFIQGFFPRGPGGAPPPALVNRSGPEDRGARAAGHGLAPARFVRVALLDGVGRETTRQLPHHEALCQRGLDLTVDVGFPTVSLPVQSALWTGLTQQQSGIEFVQARIDPPPDGSLPAREPSSAAVAESHPFISQSFGFARAWPALDITPPALAGWKAGTFDSTALAMAGSDTRLVFVHVLGADTAGHRHGGASPEYRAAAAAADALLGKLLAVDAAAHGAESLWLVVSDHGHRDAGGHGGEEPEIRLVRACLAGPGLARVAAARGRLVHLVDIARALADSLGLSPHPASAGRPLFDALVAPERAGATLPRPGPVRFALAAFLVAAALVATWLAARRSWKLPWWWVVAYLSVVAIESAPTLSTPMIYRPLGQAIYVAALPGLCMLAIIAGVAVRTVGPLRVALVQLLLPAAISAACAVLCWREPPLMPMWTALLSVSLVLSFTGAAVVGLACLSSLVPSGCGRGSPAETPGRAP